eukprot:scaffold131959_cov63-Phaeocystis_antarctica.AAC.4
MILPSSTTLESSQPVPTIALNLSTGKHVARAGSRPCGAKTTAGDAQTAAASLPALACASSSSLSSAESRRCSAPGIPPGSAMASHCLPTHSLMVQSATTVRPRASLTVVRPSGMTDAVTTVAPARASTSVMHASSMSSEASAIGTRMFIMAL